ncbi:hypothetical protein SAMN02982929_05767 [Saccharopolyspora kobensis]|uniref:Uncharacterized protein n=1 Tax=Saccharopolyspora kobensis TaxID=146035 RepID=A0A1H6E7J3_9PSEU|nr:hypothetical protein [Saccharopolyspora kobensis]SEG93223.1 hypothetical protein SAMN02982929_05767 [Saccharopolyspora kobensis]SFD43625.1 hypothetical protein SAMN05216506_104296 [Saccharopolyspora kobensis]
MKRIAVERLADVVGPVTLGMGVGLAAAPEKVGGALGLDRRFARSVGIIDLALAPGLLLGRPKWPWMAARAGLNLVLVGRYRARRVPAGTAGWPRSPRSTERWRSS